MGTSHTYNNTLDPWPPISNRRCPQCCCKRTGNDGHQQHAQHGRGGDPSVLDANYPPNWLLARGPLGGGGVVGVPGAAESPPPPGMHRVQGATPLMPWKIAPKAPSKLWPNHLRGGGGAERGGGV